MGSIRFLHVYKLSDYLKCELKKLNSASNSLTAGVAITHRYHVLKFAKIGTKLNLNSEDNGHA